MEAIYKVLIWLISPDDIFFYCFCMPLLSDQLQEIREVITENDLIKTWLSERKNGSQKLSEALSQLEICPISENICKNLRTKFDIEEDIELMNDYTKHSAFNLEQTGLMSNHKLKISYYVTSKTYSDRRLCSILNIFGLLILSYVSKISN